MKTKIVYVLVSSNDDLFFEQCLISVMSARLHMPKAYIILVCDRNTMNSFSGLRSQILAFLSETHVIDFTSNISKIERSRLLKIRLRELISGDFLYLDSDTLITQPLYDIDNQLYSVAAVLDGHHLFKSHPMRRYFLSQNKHLSYDYDRIIRYYNGGVMLVKCDSTAYEFYNRWYENYKISCQNGVYLDEPALCKSNIECQSIIAELDGTWNCQIRFGALFLANAKILHFCSKKNMPVSELSSKLYLIKIKEFGINTPHLTEYISDWKSTICSGVITCIGEDAKFAVSKQYEKARDLFIKEELLGSIYKPQKTIYELLLSVRNYALGICSPRILAKVLYKERFGVSIDSINSFDFNVMLYKLTFYSNREDWPILADKLRVRQFIKSKGLESILTKIYCIWENSNSINLEKMPNQFVLKCNHDNGSSLIIKDRASVDINFIRTFYKYKTSKHFGIETAEPHYRYISSRIFAEELLISTVDYSTSIVSYKFFSFYGKVDYCQVVYDSIIYKEQKSIIYNVHDWKKQVGFICNNEGTVDIPMPITINAMLGIIDKLANHLPFCRVDLYEQKNKVIFSEITLIPGCGRIRSFSEEFMQILGNKLHETKELWIHS